MDDHWLARPTTITLLWRIFIAGLALVVAAELAIEIAPHFSFERVLGFGAVLGFVACVGLIMFSKLLGAFLKRPDDYYDR
jgi:hypothetical protein